MDIVDTFYYQTPRFLDTIFDAAKQKNITITEMLIDHICVRLSTLLDYKHVNDVLEKYGAKIIGQRDKNIWGRPITLRKMPIPLIYNHAIFNKEQCINIMEVPAPKNIHSYIDGIQHVELHPSKQPALVNARQYIIDILTQHPSLVREKNLDSLYNPTIAYSFDINTELKIHPYPIEQVVKREEA